MNNKTSHSSNTKKPHLGAETEKRADELSSQEGVDFLDYYMLRFFTAATLIFAGLLAIYEYYLIEAPIFFDYLEMAASSAHWLLQNFSTLNFEILPVRDEAYMTKISLVGQKNTFVIVTSGCDASVVFAVLISTVAAWPADGVKKTIAIIVGLLVMYALNIVRITGMMIVEIYAEPHFDLFHEWILPSILVLGPMIYFYYWTIFSGRHPSDSAS